MAWSKSTRISVMIGLDTTFFLIELISGIYSGSLALMADAFHMLNDIITLVIGLWAVNIAKRASSDKYTYGWLRAEILGAFANAVFLIALCVSICLEAIQRFLDPPEITNPLLILIVGALGLASNIVGFFVLGGHGHSHGGGGQDHGEGHDHEHDHDHHHEHAPGSSHDELSAAEQGRAAKDSQSGDAHITDESGRVADVFPEAVLGRMSAAAQQQQQQSTRHIRFNGDGGASESQSNGRAASRASNMSSRGRQRGRTNSLRQHRPLSDIESQSIHPASFRAEIMEASRSRPQDDSSDAEQGDETAVEDPDSPHEDTPLLGAAGKGKSRNTGRSSSRRSRRNSSIHRNHNHNKPRDAAKSSHGHDHGDMGMNAMILHVIGDMLGNVGVIATALIIWKTEWHYKFYADPAISLFIALIIFKSALPLTIGTAKVLLQATPDHIDVSDVREDIMALPGIINCHHFHVWRLSDTKVVASMHIQVGLPVTEAGGEKYMKLASEIKKCLHAYGIHSVTIQPEFCLDRTHDHGEDASLSMDGSSQQRRKCGRDDGDLCLLDDCCEGRGCCSVKGSVTTSVHSHEDEENHDHEHDHGHAH